MDEKTKLHIKLGSFDIEFEGHNNFLRSELSKLLRDVNDLQINKISCSANLLESDLNLALQMANDINEILADIKSEIESMTDISEEQNFHLQIIMDRLQKMYSMLSNILKKISNTTEQITANLK